MFFPLLNVLYKQYISLQDSSIEWLINVLDCGLLLRPDIDGLWSVWQNLYVNRGLIFNMVSELGL